MVSIMSLSVPVVFAIDVADNLEADIALVEEGFVMELVERGKDICRKATFVLVGKNLHSYC